MTMIKPITKNSSTLTANGSLFFTLENNSNGQRNIYTVHVCGTFGSGTVTAFTNPVSLLDSAGSATYDVAILDSAGDAISLTSNGSFNFECNSDSVQPTTLRIKIAGATSPSVQVIVNRAS